MPESLSQQSNLEPDVQLGRFVYCESHVGPHSTGWCSVSIDRKRPLEAMTADAAFEEVKELGLPMSGYCRQCYRWIANEPWHRAGRLVCPEHDHA